MNNPRNISALIGLIGAVNNNGKTENTDEIVRCALTGEDSDEMVNKIREEKFIISPGCASCESPCGNTSDYDMTKYRECSDEILSLKEQILSVMIQICKNTKGELPETVYRGISFLAYDLMKESYVNLLREMGQ